MFKADEICLILAVLKYVRSKWHSSMYIIVTVLTCSLYFTLVNLKLDLDYRPISARTCSVLRKLNIGS